MELRDAAHTIIIVDRHRFKLKVYRREDDEARFGEAETYKIAVGQIGYQTPRGLYVINTKSKCPDWMVPDSDWARDRGLVPGTVVDCEDPTNPIKARWLGVTDPKEGVGIHGTSELESLGTEASHGCIRMAPDDVIKLFDEIPKGTPVVIL
jgi:lipoprotein-anchoring transpeptidase ErfK/SrfK